MSPVGRSWVTFGTPYELGLRIYPGVDDAHLTVEGANVYLTRVIVPTTQGEAYTFGAWELEVVDVVASGDLRFTDNRWHGTAAVPAIHVQLRVTPPP